MQKPYDLLLIKKLANKPGINFNEKDVDGMTLLYRCANGFFEDSTFNQELLTILLSKNVSFAEKNEGDKGNTVLHKMLENMTMQDEQGQWAMDVYNAFMGNAYKAKVREALLIANVDGSTPLHIALRMKNEAVVKRFLDLVESGTEEFQSKFKTDVLDRLEQTMIKSNEYEYRAPLHLAVVHGFDQSVIEQLLKLGADLQKKSETFNNGKKVEGLTPLDYVPHENVTLHDVLKKAEEVAKKAAPPIPKEGNGALLASPSDKVKKDFDFIMQSLRDSRYDNALDGDGEPTGMVGIAGFKANHPIFKMVDDKGNTMLHAISEASEDVQDTEDRIARVDLIDRMLEKCPDLLNTQNNNGDTPFMTALHNNKKSMIEHLLTKEDKLDLTLQDNKVKRTDKSITPQPTNSVGAGSSGGTSPDAPAKTAYERNRDKAVMGFIGISVILGIAYGVRKMLQTQDKSTDEYVENRDAMAIRVGQ